MKLTTGYITSKITSLRHFIQKYSGQLVVYANKPDNLEEMEKFLQKVQPYKTEPGRNRKI